MSNLRDFDQYDNLKIDMIQKKEDDLSSKVGKEWCGLCYRETDWYFLKVEEDCMIFQCGKCNNAEKKVNNPSKDWMRVRCAKCRLEIPYVFDKEKDGRKIYFCPWCGKKKIVILSK